MVRTSIAAYLQVNKKQMLFLRSENDSQVVWSVTRIGFYLKNSRNRGSPRFCIQSSKEHELFLPAK